MGGGIFLILVSLFFEVSLWYVVGLFFVFLGVSGAFGRSLTKGGYGV